MKAEHPKYKRHKDMSVCRSDSLQRSESELNVKHRYHTWHFLTSVFSGKDSSDSYFRNKTEQM